MSISEAMAKVTASEFVEWQVFLSQEERRRKRDDWNFAQVCYRIFCLEHRLAHLFAKSYPKPDVSLDDFAVTFETEAEKAAEREEVALLKAKYEEMSDEECLEDPEYKKQYDEQMALAQQLCGMLDMMAAENPEG